MSKKNEASKKDASAKNEDATSLNKISEAFKKSTLATMGFYGKIYDQAIEKYDDLESTRLDFIKRGEIVESEMKEKFQSYRSEHEQLDEGLKSFSEGLDKFTTVFKTSKNDEPAQEI